MTDAPKKSILSRIVRRVLIVTGTAATAVVAGALVVGGSNLIAARAVSIAVEEAAPLVPVSVQALEIVSAYEVPRRFVGQVEAQQQTEVAFEQGGTVAEILVDEGMNVAAGEVLARLDTRSLESQKSALQAAREALVARAELARLTTERQAALEDRGFAATQRLDEARLGLAELEARIAETDASIRGIEISLDKAVLRAPFAARIGSRFADTGATVGGGQAVLSLLEEGRPQMRVGLAPELAARLNEGAGMEVSIAGRTYAATLDHLRPDLDPATRTRIALLSIETAGAALYGQTGTVRLTEEIATEGAWVPVPSLQEGVRGLWTVLTAVPDSDGPEATVAEEAVEILYADEARALVRGTFPDGALLIEAGPHRVTIGQRVSLTEG